MCDWMGKIQCKKVFLAAFLYLVISFVIRQIEATLTMKYYLMPEYFGVWSKAMMPNAGPPPASFFILSLTFTFITGLTFAAFYDFIKGLLPKSFWPKILAFTEIMILLMLVISYLPMYLLINLPLSLISSWFVSGTISIFLGSIVFAKIIR